MNVFILREGLQVHGAYSCWRDFNVGDQDKKIGQSLLFAPYDLGIFPLGRYNSLRGKCHVGLHQILPRANVLYPGKLRGDPAIYNGNCNSVGRILTDLRNLWIDNWTLDRLLFKNQKDEGH